MHVFKIELTCSRKTGAGIQQRSIDSLVIWCAALSPDKGIELVNKITTLMKEILPGALVPISESAARTIEALSKESGLLVLPAQTESSSLKPEPAAEPTPE